MIRVKTHSGNRERGLEWLSAIAMLLWGFMLAQPGDTLATPNFQEFAVQGLTEDRLSWIFGFVGGARLAILFINGRWPKTPFARVVGAIVGGTIWLQVASMFGVSFWFYGIAGTGFVIYALLALADLTSVFWAAFDARYHSS